MFVCSDLKPINLSTFILFGRSKKNNRNETNEMPQEHFSEDGQSDGLMPLITHSRKKKRENETANLRFRTKGMFIQILFQATLCFNIIVRLLRLYLSFSLSRASVSCVQHKKAAYAVWFHFYFEWRQWWAAARDMPNTQKVPRVRMRWLLSHISVLLFRFGGKIMMEWFHRHRLGIIILFFFLNG